MPARRRPTANVSTVVEGEGIELMMPKSYTVGARCDQDTGLWVCVSCQRILGNNLQKDLHIRVDETHRLAWLCRAHGPETP